MRVNERGQVSALRGFGMLLLAASRVATTPAAAVAALVSSFISTGVKEKQSAWLGGAFCT